MQAGVVRWHAPTPQVMVPRPSSIWPSQSSSRPLQTSALGSTSPVQVPKAPPPQERDPVRHTPTPAVPVGPV